MKMLHVALIIVVHFSWSASSVLFGLHNNISSTLSASQAVNAWIQEGVGGARSGVNTLPPEDDKLHRGLVGVQAVTHYLLPQQPNSPSSLSEDLVAIWNNGSIPLIKLLPSYDPSSGAFDAFMTDMSPSFNDAVTTDSVVTASMISFVCSVAVPFLFPSAAMGKSSSRRQDRFTSEAGTSFCNGTLGPLSIQMDGELVVPSRRMYIEFAPGFTSSSYPWSSHFTGNVSAVINTSTAIPLSNNRSWNISNTPNSYQTMWSVLMGNVFLGPMQDWLFSQVASSSISSPGSNQSAAFETFRLSRFVQVVWTASATQMSPAWPSSSQSAVSSWGSALEAWLPNWHCLPSGSLFLGQLCASRHTCGPDWFGLTAVVRNTTLGNVAPTDLVSPMLSAIMQVGDAVAQSSATALQWCRAPELNGQPVPVAMVSFGASADVPLQGGAQRKDQWIHDLLSQIVFAVDSRIRIAIPINVEYHSWVLGAPLAQLFMEIYSFDYKSLCCDGVDPLTGAGVLNQVSAALIDALSKQQLVSVVARQPSEPSGSFCMSCRLVTDAVFLGYGNHTSGGGGSSPCVCPIVPPPPAVPWYQRIFKNPIVLSCMAVVVLIVVVIVVWRMRNRTVRKARKRMILGRYVVRRIIHHCRTFSSVLLADDASSPQGASSVVIKQFVLNNDTVIAVANNEIEKSRACTGYPHLAQVIQCTFAWKQQRRKKSQDGNQRKSGSGNGMHARLLPDPSLGNLQNGAPPQTHEHADARHMVLNAANAAKTPFAILVMQHYALGDLKLFIHQMKEMNGGDRSLDPHSGFRYSDAVSLLTQLCLALHTLHEVVRPDDAMIHRDIKPDNIFLERRPLRGKPAESVVLAYLGDFGCTAFSSQLVDESRPGGGGGGEHERGRGSVLAGKAVGTSTYMSYEARHGHYSPKSDIWSLGCVMLFTFLRHCPDDFFVSLKDHHFVQATRSVLSKDALCPNWFVDIILMNMLHHDRTRRPAASDVLNLIRKHASASLAVDAALRGCKTEDVFGSPTRVHPFDETTTHDDNGSFVDARSMLDDNELDPNDPHTIVDDEDIAETSDHFQP